MRIKPFFKGELATKIFKAFLINAFVAALLSTIIVEVRRDLDNEKTTVAWSTPKTTYGEAEGAIVMTATLNKVKPFDTAITLAIG